MAKNTSIERDLADLERSIALLRSLGKTHLPVRFELIEALISRERTRRATPTRVPFGGGAAAPPSLE